VMIHRAMFGSTSASSASCLSTTLVSCRWARARAGDRAAGLRSFQRVRNLGERHAQRRRDTRRALTLAASRSGARIRDAELRKIPYMLVVGEREQSERTVSVREHRGGDSAASRSQTSRAPTCIAILTCIAAPQISERHA